MIKLTCSIPKKEVAVACSGGADSMAAMSFCYYAKAVFFNHGTETSNQAQEFLQDFCSDNKIELIIGKVEQEKSSEESWEEYWRNCRYKFFHELPLTIVTAHNLDDCVETWLFTSFHGLGKIIPEKRNNVIRPFRLNKKVEMVEWCRRRNIEWLEDSTNQDTKYARNRIRHNILPEVLKVNPGIYKVVAKKISKE